VRNATVTNLDIRRGRQAFELVTLRVGQGLEVEANAQDQNERQQGDRGKHAGTRNRDEDWGCDQKKGRQMRNANFQRRTRHCVRGTESPASEVPAAQPQSQGTNCVGRADE
jgi:hypothetical protein